MERQNAVIRKTFLGWEDHGIFTFILDLDYGGGHQGAGNLWLGNAKGVHARTGDMISAILKVAGVGSWEKLQGRPIVAITDDGLVRGLAPLLGGEELFFAELFKDA